MPAPRYRDEKSDHIAETIHNKRQVESMTCDGANSAPALKANNMDAVAVKEGKAFTCETSKASLVNAGLGSD